MAKILTLNTKNGTKDYTIEDLSFINIICDLEDKGVNVFDMAQGNGNFKGRMKDIRTIFATIIGEPDLRKAGDIMSEHMANGGKLDDVFAVFTDMMQQGGFGSGQKKSEKAAQEKPNT